MKKKVLAIALAACMVVGLVPVAMTNANVNANEKQETTSELDVQTEPEMVPIKVIFRDGQGTKVGDARVIVSEDTTKVPATSLVAPKGYKIVSVGNISGRGTLFVQVEKIEEEKEPEMVAVNVIYTEKGEKIGESRTVIWDNVTEVPATSLVAPEGYKIVLVGNIDWESQTLNVEVEKIVSEELPTEKGFRIYYVTESGREISHHTVKAQITRVGELEVITVEADQLRVPEGYELVETPDLTFTNGEKETKLVVKAIEKEPVKHSIQVKYVTSTGIEKGTERVTVVLDEANNGVITKADLKRIPEGYVLFNENDRAVNKDTKTIEIAVEEKAEESKPLPTEKNFRIYYVTESGRELLHHTVKAQITRVGELEVITVEADQLRVPEGYELVETPDLAFTNGEKETKLVVKAIEKEPVKHSIQVKYVTTTGIEKGTERVTVVLDEANNGVITKADLKRIPEGYVLFNENDRAVNKDTKTVEIAVEKKAEESKPLPTEKSFRIYYVTESGRELFHHTVKAQITRVGELEIITVEADQLRVPEGYELVETPDLAFTNGEKETKLVVKAIEKEPVKHSIQVKYVTTTGVEKGTERVTVVLDEANNGVITKADLKRIPEGYVLFNENDRAVNKDTKTVEIAVEKKAEESKPLPTEKSFRIYYVTESGRELLHHTVKAQITRVGELEIITVEADQLRVPEGYELVETPDLTFTNGEKETKLVVKAIVPLTPLEPSTPIEPEVPVEPEVPSKPEGTDWVEIEDNAKPVEPEGTDWVEIEDSAKPVVKPAEKPAEKPADKTEKPADKKPAVKPAKESKTPKTGDMAHVGVWFSVVALSGAAVVVFSRKRKNS